MTRRVKAGVLLMFFGILAGAISWISIIEAAPVLRVPSCKGWLQASSLCDPSIHSLHGGYAIGVVASILGGLAVFALGVVIACTKSPKKFPRR